MIITDWTTKRFSEHRTGYRHDVIYESGEPYLERRMLEINSASLRWHTFLKGDESRHLHDHPWDFWTFPLEDYEEYVDILSVPKLEQHIPGVLSTMHAPGKVRIIRKVQKFRWHYRPAGYRHAVIEPRKKIHTLVVTGPIKRVWGFWVDGEFVPHNEYFQEAA